VNVELVDCSGYSCPAALRPELGERGNVGMLPLAFWALEVYGQLRS